MDWRDEQPETLTPEADDLAAREPESPAGAKTRRFGAGENTATALLLALVLLFALILFAVLAVAGGFRALFMPAQRSTNPPENSFSILYVVGSIGDASADAYGVHEPSYRHRDTVNYIRSLIDNENDRGILLYMNTGGGGVYESDEIYRALSDYREATGRPVWAYMAQTCASGGYYICTAAEHLVANYNTTTGSIGVYIQLTDTSGLYEMLGIETVLVRSGDNKGIGTGGVEITEEQRAVYQSLVDESYERFVALVATGRGMSEGRVRTLADGRPYTAAQALANGLVDEVGDWETTRTAFEEHTGATAFTPSFSQRTPIGALIGTLGEVLPEGETEAALNLADSLPHGVPLMVYDPAVW